MVKLRAATALVILFLFPIVVLALIAGAAVLVVLASMQSSALGRFVLQLLLVPLAVGVIAAVREAFRTRPEPADGPELSREDQPALWAAVDQLAEAAQTEAPDRIVLIAETNAAVRQVGRQRELLLGLPLLAGLTVGELRSVLAHELGHFAGGDTALAARTMRAGSFLHAAKEHAGVLIRWFYALYYRAFIYASARSSRDLERRADQYSAEAAGPVVAASAMRKLVGLSMTWDFVVEDRVSLFEPAGARAPLHEAVTRTLRARQHAIQSATDRALQEEGLSWDDTHPLTANRIATFLSMPATGAPNDERAALELIGGDTTLARLEGDLLAQSWPLTGWDQVAAQAGAQVLPERMDRMVLALHEDQVIDQPTPAAVLRAAQVDPAALGSRLTGDPDSALEATGEAVRIVICGVLARVPGVRMVLDEEDELGLVDIDGVAIRIGELAEEGDALLSHLEAYGAQVDLPTDRALLPELRPASVVLGALTMTLAKRPRRVRDLLICSDGLLFVPLKQSPWTALGGANTKHSQRLRV